MFSTSTWEYTENMAWEIFPNFMTLFFTFLAYDDAKEPRIFFYLMKKFNKLRDINLAYELNNCSYMLIFLNNAKALLKN